MIEYHLMLNNKPFDPALYQGKVNTGALFTAEVVADIAREAYHNNPLLIEIGKLILPKMFDAGLCTGMSAWTLLKFAHEGNLLEEIYQSAILQARILSPQVVKRVAADCVLSHHLLLKRLIDGIISENFLEFPLLMLIPRLNNMINLAHAHTLVPYKITIKGTFYMIDVYDCNYPKEKRTIILEEREGCWRYSNFSNDK